MNPKKLGSLANHDQETWKMPLPEYIEHLYEKRFGRTRPESVMSIEERARLAECLRNVLLGERKPITICRTPARRQSGTPREASCRS